MRVALADGAALAERALFGEAKPFERFDGGSSGIHPWMYLLAGSRHAEGGSIPYEELSKGFMSYWNLITKRKYVDLGLMMAAFREGQKSLDFDRILEHPTETHVYATSVSDARVVDFRIGRQALAEEQGLHYEDNEYIYFCHTKEDVCKALEATAHIPVYAGRPVAITDTIACVDGGLSAAGRVPLRRAISSGATHILVFWTDKITEANYPRSNKEKFAAWWLRRHHPELAANYWTGHEEHRRTIKMIEQAEENSPGLPMIEVVRVPDDKIPNSRETRSDKLYLATLAGMTAMLEAFAPHDLPVDESVNAILPRRRRARILG